MSRKGTAAPVQMVALGPGQAEGQHWPQRPPALQETLPTPGCPGVKRPAAVMALPRFLATGHLLKLRFSFKNMTWSSGHRLTRGPQTAPGRAGPSRPHLTLSPHRSHERDLPECLGLAGVTWCQAEVLRAVGNAAWGRVRRERAASPSLPQVEPCPRPGRVRTPPSSPSSHPRAPSLAAQSHAQTGRG